MTCFEAYHVIASALEMEMAAQCRAEICRLCAIRDFTADCMQGEDRINQVLPIGGACWTLFSEKNVQSECRHVLHGSPGA